MWTFLSAAGRARPLTPHDASTGQCPPGTPSTVEGELPSSPSGAVSPLSRYQRGALLLCAGSYAVDNMWLQAIAACLPRVADEWELSSAQVARLSSSTFFGMLSAFAWGFCTFSSSHPFFFVGPCLSFVINAKRKIALLLTCASPRCGCTRASGSLDPVVAGRCGRRVVSYGGIQLCSTVLNGYRGWCWGRWELTRICYPSHGDHRFGRI